MEGSKMIVFVMFVLVSGVLISRMPREIYDSGYADKQRFIPRDFETWQLIPRDFLIEHPLVKGGSVLYDFTQSFNTTMQFQIRWNFFPVFDNQLHVRGLTSSEPIGFRFSELEPSITKAILISGWSENDTVSFVRVYDETKMIELYFEDQNITRNNIGLAFDNNMLNCSMAIPTSYQTDQEVIGARDMIMALLTFRLPSIFTTMNPMLGFIMSAILYVPIAFIFFYVVISIIHGA